MHIKTRLSFQFTFIVTGILLFFSTMVYYFSYTSQLNRFRDNLLEKAKNTAILLINVTEVDSTLLKKIHKSTILLQEEEIALADSSFNLLYSYNIKYLSNKLIRLNSDETELNFFSVSEKDGVCFKHHYKNFTYNVLVMAFDKSRTENLSELRNILFWGILISIWLSVLFAYFFSLKAMNPISKIIKSVKEINSLKLNTRIDEGNRKDEIAQLAITFNEMIEDLEISFKNQEDFVSNASHELRTPLTVIIAESNFILSREQTQDEYMKHISNMVNDLKRLNTLLNDLLELAHMNRDKNIVFSNVRIDEIIFNAIHQVKNKYQERKIIPKIYYPELGSDLFISGNDGLLTIAFKNLLDNACKFSDKEVLVEFLIKNEYINISISDSGMGIPSEELKSIFEPFKRANNVRFIAGFGIGLSLVAKIMGLHDAEISVYSKESKGTRFDSIFRRVTE